MAEIDEVFNKIKKTSTQIEEQHDRIASELSMNNI
jgi:hypothetical protein